MDTDTTAGSVRFSVLGRLGVEVEGVQIPLGAVKQQLVLAVLLARANAVTPVETLIDTLWADAAPRTARKNVQVYVAGIRKLLGAGGKDRISFGIGGYRLLATPAELDVLEFVDLVSQARRAARINASVSAAELFARALALWHGPVLEGLVTGPVLEGWANHVAGLHPAAFEDWAESELACGNPVQAVDRICEMAVRYPFRERLRGLQMTALWRCGRQGEALAVFDELRQLLARDLGLEPGAALRELYRQVLHGERTERRAIELTPPDPPDFVGRVHELDRLRGALQPGAVVVVSGPAGVGKTTLAVRAAHQLADRFPHGRLLVRLRESDGTFRSAPDVLAELVRSVGLGPAGGEDAQALWLDWLRNRRVVLVVDGAGPHVSLPAGLLPAVLGRSAVVVTGRPRMPTHCSRVELSGLVEAEAVTLLRAVSGRDIPVEVAGRIVTAVGLLPVTVRATGLRLRRLRHVPVGEFAARLSDPGELLHELDGEGVLGQRLAGELADLPPGDRDAALRLAELPEPRFTLAEAAHRLGQDGRETLRRLEALIELDVVTAPVVEVSAHTALYELSILVYALARTRA